MSSYSNPLTGHATDDFTSAMKSILDSDPTDENDLINQLRAWDENAPQQNKRLRQVLNIYRMGRLTSAADSTLIDAALALV